MALLRALQGSADAARRQDASVITASRWKSLQERPRTLPPPQSDRATLRGAASSPKAAHPAPTPTGAPVRSGGGSFSVPGCDSGLPGRRTAPGRVGSRCKPLEIVARPPQNTPPTRERPRGPQRAHTIVQGCAKCTTQLPQCPRRCFGGVTMLLRAGEGKAGPPRRHKSVVVLRNRCKSSNPMSFARFAVALRLWHRLKLPRSQNRAQPAPWPASRIRWPETRCPNQDSARTQKIKFSILHVTFIFR